MAMTLENSSQGQIQKQLPHSHPSVLLSSPPSFLFLSSVAPLNPARFGDLAVRCRVLLAKVLGIPE